MKDKIAIALAFLAVAGARAADVYWTQAVSSSSPTEVTYSDSVWSATPASGDTCFIGRNGSMGSTTGDDGDFLVTFESLETLGAKTLWVENNGKTMTWLGSAIANGFTVPEFNIGTLGKIIMQNGTFSATGDVAVGAYRAGALTVDENATFTAGTLRVGRYENGDGTLTINKDGVANISTIYIADNHANSQGRIEIDGGSLEVASLNIAQTGKTTGTVTLKSGALTVTGDAKLANGAGASGATTKGYLNIESGTASFEKALYLCNAGWSETELNISGGETTIAGDFDIGRGSTAVATVSGGKLVANGNTRIGRNSGGNGTLRITGGEVTLANNVYMADGGGTGTLEVDGGTLTVTHEFRGAQGGNTTSAILVKSGTANFNDALDIANNNSTCTMTVSGGEVNCGSEIYVGRSNAGANGTLTLDGGTVSVGTASATRRLKLAIDNSTGTLNLNKGGTLNVWRIDASGSKNTINFNGGTLVALGNGGDVDYFWGADSNTANIAIGENGVVIDTAGFDKKTGTAVAITGSGTITKAGEGKLTMESLDSFSGSFVLTGGTLVLPAQKTVRTMNGYRVAESESSGTYTYTLVQQPCKIGETYYNTLGEALTAANNASPVSTIEINSASCTDNVTVGSGQTLVLKADAGHVYTGTITLNGGTLKYGTDEWTDANNPAAVPTDWSGLVKNSTGFISVDTGTNEVTWASEGLYTNNTDTKGVVKKGSGTWRLAGTNREGSWQLFTSAARTNIVEEGTLEIMNSKYNSSYTISSKILGTGTLRILPSEHDGAVWLKGTDAFADFAGTLEWANDLSEASYASGFRMTDYINFEMPKARMRVTGNPAVPTCVMKCETQHNPDSAHVTVGAFDHLYQNAEIRCERSAWTLNILGTAGDSYLNGAFTENAVYIVKSGADSTMTIGSGFSAVSGSTVTVNAGELVVNSGATIPGTLTIANGARLSGSGSCSTLTLASGAIVDLGITADTDTATTPAGIVSAAKPDVSGATLANASANPKGTWQLVAQQNSAGAYVLTATFVSHGMIVTLDGKETGIDDAAFSNWLTTSGYTPTTKDALVTSNANGISPLVAYMLGYETYDEATSVAPRMTAQTTGNAVKLDFASYENARKDFLGSANLQCYLMTSDDNVNWEKTPVGLLPAEVEFTSASLYTKLGAEVVGDTTMVDNLVGAQARDQSELEWDNYQYHVAVTGITSGETQKNPMAHLWIPEEIKDGGTVEGIVFGMHNMLEEPIFAHPDFRREIAAANMAILWVTPMIVQDVTKTALTDDETAAITTMFANLATASGHAELATAPVTVIGHSALGTFPFEFAAQFKERTRLAMSVKGDWPESNRPSWSVFQEVAANGTPMLCVSGEYEDGYRRKAVGVSSLLAAVPGADFHAWVDVGGGHFDWSDELCRALGRYITTPAKRDAIIAAYEALPRGVGGFTVLGVKTNGVALAQNKDLHLQILFDMKGSEVVDGYEFKLEPFFEDTVPEGRPEGWTGLAAGSANPKPSAANAEDKLVIQKISGPVEHISGNRWRIKYCSLYDTAGYRSGEAVFQIIYPGDDDFKRCVQQFQINVKRP